MSRKRKRRARNLPQENRAAAADSQGAEIEIVDDVGGLDAAAKEDPDVQAAAPAAPEVTAEATAAPAPTPTDSADDATPASEPAPATSTVHVVESLHESPVAHASGERNVETLGELLQHAREARGLSLQEVSARTRIALPTLRHLEHDRFGELPAEAYVKGFLRSYGGFLNLDVAMLLRRYEKLSGHVRTPVAEIWDEVEVDTSSLRLWMPSRRTLAVTGVVLVVAALAWVFWSQGAVMLGLRPEGELQQIEMQLQRESRDGSTPQAPITGLDDAALQQEPAAVGEKTAARVPMEDTAPTVPLPPDHKPPAGSDAAPTSPQPSGEVGGEAAPKPAAEETKDRKPAPKPQPPVEKPKKKAPAPSPEDAAGPPG